MSNPTKSRFTLAYKLAEQLHEEIIASSKRSMEEDMPRSEIKDCVNDLAFIVETAVYDALNRMDIEAYVLKEQEEMAHRLALGMPPF